jgi:hypothetical protein
MFDELGGLDEELGNGGDTAQGGAPRAG